MRPHMVDNRYYGRGERTNRKLGDAEVLRLHRARGSELELSRAALDALHNQDRYLSARPGAEPSAEPVAERGHLYLVATPHRRVPDRADDLVWESQDKLRAFDQASDAALNDLLRNWASHLSTGSQIVQRSTAISLTNFREDLRNDRLMEQYGMDLRLEADGTVGLIYTGFSDAADGEQPGVIADGTLVGGVWKLLTWLTVSRSTLDTREAGTSRFEQLTCRGDSRPCSAARDVTGGRTLLSINPSTSSSRELIATNLSVRRPLCGV